MASTRNAPPEGYDRSRAALRRLYGARKIDASAPVSAADTTPSGMNARDRGYADTTPSGRQRERVQAGMSPLEARKTDNAQWRTLFPEPEATPLRPLAMLSNRRPPGSTLEAIQQAQANGAAYGSFPVPQYGGSVGFTRPSLMPSEPVADTSDLAGLSPMGGFTPMSFFKPRPRPSILSGAQNWINPI